MVRASYFLVWSVVAAADNAFDDTSSMLQAKISTHDQDKVCLPVNKGDIAPSKGLFNGRQVEIGEVAQTSGTFCVDKDVFALVQRSLASSSAQDVDTAVAWKNAAAATTVAPTTVAPTVAPTTVAPTVAPTVEKSVSGKGKKEGPKLQDSWDHHFKAFGGQNLDEIVKDYSEEAEINIVNWVDGSMQTFRGLKGVRQAFAELFAQMTDLSDLGAPVVQVDEKLGTVFLIWKNPASGYKYGTDSFMVDSNGKFVRQHVVVSKLGSDAVAAVVPDPAKDGLPVHSAWKRHFAAFGSQSVDDVVVDYAKDTKINVYNQADGSLTTYHGHSGVRDCFKELFANLHDTSDLTAPVQVVEEGAGNRPGRVLLLWSCPASGYLNGTDTFVANQEGKFTQQNVVVNYQRKIPSR